MNKLVDGCITGRSLVSGHAHGSLLVSSTGLSFWGGVNPLNGEVIDQFHPLRGERLAGRVLAIPGGRGSCSGSGALLELILNGCAPAALVFTETEEILTLGVIVAETMFGRTLPVICIDPSSFAKLQNFELAQVNGNHIRLSGCPPFDERLVEESDSVQAAQQVPELTLGNADQALLEGSQGRAAQVAMQIVLRMAKVQGASELLDIEQAHIDACVYNGPSSLRFAQKLVDWGARVQVPTTLNSLSVDKQRWHQQGIDPDLGEPASLLGDAYMSMGAQLSYTCAPYLLDTAPAPGENIVWAESNAVMFANSIIGARTQKYPDFLDACIALTGRAPATGCHLDTGRHATLSIRVDSMENTDDAFWPTLGYHVGLKSGHHLPIIYGLENSAPDLDDLKAFSAAFATTSSTAMFHIFEITPEASWADEHWRIQGKGHTAINVTAGNLHETWRELNSALSSRVELVSLGNPHFSLTECATLARLCDNRKKDPDVPILVTLGRAVYARAEAAGYVSRLQNFGVQFITDTCWCMITEPIIPESAQTLMTNSAKYAHYGPGQVGRQFHFGSLAECVDAACSGFRSPDQLALFANSSI